MLYRGIERDEIYQEISQALLAEDEEKSWLNTDIKVHLITINVANQNDFSAEIAAANYLATLCKMTWFILGKEDLNVYLQGYTEELLEDKATRVYFLLDTNVDTGPGKYLWPCPVLWQWFHLLLLRKLQDSRECELSHLF